MKKIDTFSHYREGKSQMQRFLTELNPGNLELHDFDLFDWLLFANNFANHVNYFGKDDATTPAGTWEGFFLGADDYTIPRRESVAYKSLKKEVTELVAQFEKDGSLTPHLTLFICFIKLMDFSKKAFNNLTQRHLDFYYKEILKIDKQDAQSDKVYVIFELAKKAIQERVPEGTLLDAKKDATGKKRVFKTDKELIASQAKVVELKSFLNDTTKKELKMARVANTLDGLTEKLPEQGNYWWPFGYNSNESKPQKSDFKELENAKLGFAIASSLFNLKEGERTVTVTISFEENGTSKLAEMRIGDIENNLKLLCSGEKEWMSGAALKCLKNDSKMLQLAFTLGKEFPAVVNYNKEALGGTFQTDLAVVRFVVEGSKYYSLYEALAEKEIKNVNVTVDVKGVKSVLIENDNSTLNPEKDYFPFTGQPVTGSNLYIKYPEMFAKKWQKAAVTINWKNTPDSIKDLYKGYILKPNQEITKATFDAAKNNASIVDKDSYFKANASLLEREVWSVKATNIELFQKKGTGYQTNFSVNNASSTRGASEAIRLTLNQSALQDVYPKLYTLALTSGERSVVIPNEPYIPLAADIELSYTASESVYTIVSLARDSKPVKSDGVKLFYEDAFGQFEKDATIKNLVPVHKAGGELYIGLDANPGETVSLLIQTLEGSENALADTFQENENIEWDYLSNNEWLSLKKYILINETKRFLESGILQFKVPKDIITNNTRFTEKVVWIRAKTKTSYDAVCKIQGIYTQAVLATFQNQDNDLSHLENGLEAGTISKLITRVPQIKSVSQPYNAFDGKYKEADEAFYRRVSERLRHKNRAITQWDYEQLILQEFPNVFMAKCLNHTSEKSFMAPGHVTIVVVPNTKNKNAFDVYQPRVSRASLNKIQNYVNGLNTMQVKAQVINPNYQEATIKASVRFFDKYDEAFYSKQLDEDIKKYISPWAFGDSDVVSFNVKLNVNQLVNYLEQLYYVDYIDELQVSVNNIPQTKYLIEVDPKSILVSAKQHVITIAEQVCI
ncbi:baseplate J/gp47 family protein [Flavobacterium cerinum]|uniref:Baseplate J/gp47 family protein n=1 Tax=Flavobacterium cerinum TaxID=2502784 RepID=A0ABY5IVX8_9FLAO|nr:baseplate J/gp47 family protein [Flavobacterium cerinum]UUC46526.1 baseplate J/gp47 family protein [Flavobacterium cerinum]